MKYTKSSIIFFLILNIVFSVSCKKVLEIPLPNDQLSGATVFTTTSTINASVNGMYSAFLSQTNQASYLRNLYLLSDEGFLSPAPSNDLGLLISANIVGTNTWFNQWSYFYTPIYRANLLLENLPSVPKNILSDSLKNSYICAARYVRAVNHFILATTWGDVPLVTSSDVVKNQSLGRTKTDTVFNSVISDLQYASANLSPTVLDSRTIHNKYQALAFLARVYLYLGKWSSADSAASAVINSNNYQLVNGTTNVFKRGSKETILSLAETSTSSLSVNRTAIGWYFLPSSSASATGVNGRLNDSLLRVFEPADQRKVEGNWVVTMFTFKYPNKYLYSSVATTATINANPQDYVVQRLAEMHLIRAEARAQAGLISGSNSAATDLNLIRSRAGLTATTANSLTTMMAAIEKERICELFGEGFRWYDLKRWNKIDAVLSAVPYKSAAYKNHFSLWPIAQNELLTDPNLVQNPGY